MTLRCMSSLAVGFLSLVFSDAALAKDWSGLFFRVGDASGSGDFTVLHQHETFSLGTLLSVPTEGDLNMVGVVYRWSLWERVYVGAKIDLYNGDLIGQREHEYHGLHSSFSFRTTLTGTVGVQLGYAFGQHERLLGYVGGGGAGSKAHMRATAAFEDLAVAKDWDGGALGPYIELGANYAFTDTVSGFLEVKKFFYEVSDSCSVEGYGCGHVTAGTSPVVLTAGIEIKF